MADRSMEAMVEESIFADLRDALLTELKEAGDPWQKMSQSKQDEIIERVDKRVRDRVREATGLIVTHDFPSVAGAVDGITVKDKTKITVVVDRMTPDCHDLIDAGQGASVRVVLADARAFEGIQGSVTSEPDQPELVPADEEGTSGMSTIAERTSSARALSAAVAAAALSIEHFSKAVAPYAKRNGRKPFAVAYTTMADRRRIKRFRSSAQAHAWSRKRGFRARVL